MNKKVALLSATLFSMLCTGVAFAQKDPNPGPRTASSAPRSGSNPEGTPTLTITVPVSGVQTFATCNFAAPTAGNTTVAVNLGPNAVVTGLGGAGTIRTFGGSFLSEAAVQFFGAVPAETIRFRPLSTLANTGPAGTAYNAIPPIDLSTNSLPNITLGATGVLTLEFCETFDDAASGPDAEFVAPSNIVVQCFNCVDPFAAAETVPAPAMGTWSMLALLLGLGLVGGVAVRRFS